MLAITHIRHWVSAPREKKPTGYTLLEMIFALAIIAGLITMFLKVGIPAMARAELSQAMTNVRLFQSAVTIYYAEHHEVPTTEELYRTILRGEEDLGFVAVAAKDIQNLPTHRQANQAPFRLPERWLIVSREDFMPLAEFIYAIDDREPEQAPPDHPPFDHQWMLDFIDQLSHL